MAGRISQAAACAKSTAEQFETDYNYEEAAKFYLKASKSYEVDNTPTTGMQMLTKWADL